MPTITLTGGFKPIPEGEHIFRIYDVEYAEKFGNVRVKMVNAQGETYIERFGLMKKDGTPNDGACSAFSFFAKTAMNDSSLLSIEPEQLINHYIKLEIVHTVQPNQNDPTKTVTFVNSGKKSAAEGFDTEPCERALKLCRKPETVKKEIPKTETGDVDLGSLLD